MRALAATVAAVMLCALVSASAGAAEIPPYDGLMSFPHIQSPAEPEEFSWEVQLGEEESLELIDDQRAVVRWSDGTIALGIRAQAAHDASGATVPTTLAVIQPNVITLTVHHRAGNPAAGGAPFDYPVIAGEGWEGGFQTHFVQGPPSQETAPPPTSTPALSPAPPAPRCLVPDLSGLTVKASRRQLRKSNCRLGEVRGERSRGAKVFKQFRQPGKSLPAGTEVGIKLLPAAHGNPASR
jgi:hypothetical protein